MNKKLLPFPVAAELRRRAEAELQTLGAEGKDRPLMTEIARRVAARLRKQRSHQQSETGDRGPDVKRLVHELQVHQVELEMQNAELQAARDRMEALVEKYTDLYDFAPVGYFTLDEQGQVLEVNLTGAALLGVERSRLVNRRLPPFVVPTSRPSFLELGVLHLQFDLVDRQFVEQPLGVSV